MMDIRKVLLQCFIIFFKKRYAKGDGFKSAIKQNQQQLAKELHKQIIKKFKNRKDSKIHHLKAILGVDILQICN